MTEIIPRQDTEGIDSFLAGALPVARFFTQRDEFGDITYSRPRFGGGTLCSLKFRDMDAKYFLANKTAIKPVRDLNPEPYKSIRFEVEGEGEFNGKSLSDIFGMIPSEERGRFVYFEPLYVGTGPHGEKLVEIRLYERFSS